MGRLKQKKFLCHRSRKLSEVPGMNNCMIGYVFLTTVTILYFLVALACSLTGYSTIADIFMCTGYTGLGLSGLYLGGWGISRLCKPKSNSASTGNQPEEPSLTPNEQRFMESVEDHTNPTSRRLAE